MLGIVERIAGVLLMIAILGDVFMTVLYARIGKSPLGRLGTGVISSTVASAVWHIIRAVSRRLGKMADDARSLSGPVGLVAVIGVWAIGLTFGAALVIQPALGGAVKASSGATPTDFGVAIYVGGAGLATVGAADFAPKTAAYRIFYLLTSLTGAGMISLTVTYLLQLYNALELRNTLGLKLRSLSDATGDASEIVAAFGPEDHFEAGYTAFTDLGAELARLAESFHFYPMLFYFRSREIHHALARIAFLALDTATLVRSALSDEEHAWVMESAAVSMVWSTTTALLERLEESFLPSSATGEPGPPDERDAEIWMRRFAAARRRLAQAGIDVIDDEQRGAEIYVALRAHWNRRVLSLGEYMAQDREEIDPLLADPEASDRRPPYRARRHGAG